MSDNSKHNYSQAAHLLLASEAEARAGYHRQVHEIQQEYGVVLPAEQKKALFLSWNRHTGAKKNREVFSKHFGNRKNKTKRRKGK